MDMIDVSWRASPATRAPTSRAIDWTPYSLALLFLGIHILLALLVDTSDVGVFLRADRAAARMETVLGLLASVSAEQMAAYLASHGILGDYAVHAWIYSIGGRWAVVGVQILLAVLSGLCVYWLAQVLGLSRRASATTMAVYLCMPHSLVFPHQLATEALHMPLLVISTWLLAKGLVQRRPAWLICSALLLGAATLVRPITLLWPFVAALAVAMTCRPMQAAIYGFVAYLPILSWMGFIMLQTGEPGLGKSDHSMERNLYERVMRITATLPPTERDAARSAHLPPAREGSERSLGPLGYLRFSADYPGASLKHLMHDVTSFFGKSGVERITIDYLALTPNARALQDPDHGWRQQLELHGWPHTLRYLWQTLGKTLLISLIGSAAFIALFVLSCIGALQFVRSFRQLRSPRVAVGMLLVSLVAYVFVFSHVLNAVQSRQRAPAEFAIVLLAAAGFSAVRQRYRRRRQLSAPSTLSTSFHAQ
jgi:hypothetical protein